MGAGNVVFGPLAATFLIGITTLVLFLWYSSRKHQYWKKRGIPFAKPYPLVGSVIQNFFEPQQDVELKRYNELGPIYGHYEGYQPLLSVADPKLLKDIMVKDFHIFMNRRLISTGDSTMDNMLTNLKGEDWKRVRTIMTPTFSTGKLKRMMAIFKECSMTLVHNFQNAVDEKKPIEVKIMYGALAMDVIANSAFSTKIDSHNDPENMFVQRSRKAFGSGVTWRFLLFMLSPRLMKLLGLSILQPEVTDFFKTVTKDIIEERRRLGQTRNDFLQLLVDTVKEEVEKEKLGDAEEKSDLANYGQEVADQKVFVNSVTKSLSFDELVAQCVVFFIGGNDTISSTLSFATYFLAVDQEVQEKAYQEIRECLEETKGELTYEVIQKMKYLDNVISETLRYYPPPIRHERQALVDYKLSDTDITVTKNMLITIPVYAMHRDPKYYPNPEKFDPDRFTPEEREKRDPFAYLPFGAGPRNCVGMRFALLEVKVCLIHVISYFNIKTCPQTTIPLQFDLGIGLLKPKDIYLEMEPRKDCPLTK